MPICWPHFPTLPSFFVILSVLAEIHQLRANSFWLIDVRRPAVPRWEKLFCSSVSSITWERIVETKKYMCKYNNIVSWDDSAAKEAFDNAKSRFWADINGLPCNIPFPDPDMYIDDIDWNSSVDPELLLDLDNVTTFPSQEESNKGVVIFGDAPLLDQSIPCSGWDEPEKDALKPAEFVSGAQVNLHENKNVTPREQDDAPYYAAKESEWQ